MNGLGRRQRRIIAEMALHGGHWPDGRRTHADDRTVLDSLARKGLVTLAGPRAALTAAGRELSDHLAAFAVGGTVSRG